MCDPQQRHELRVLVDPVQDPVRSAASAERTGKFPFEGLADPLLCRCEVTEDEFDDR